MSCQSSEAGCLLRRAVARARNEHNRRCPWRPAAEVHSQPRNAPTSRLPCDGLGMRFELDAASGGMDFLALIRRGALVLALALLLFPGDVSGGHPLGPRLRGHRRRHRPLPAHRAGVPARRPHAGHPEGRRAGAGRRPDQADADHAHRLQRPRRWACSAWRSTPASPATASSTCTAPSLARVGAAPASGRFNQVVRVTLTGSTVDPASLVELLSGIRTDNGNHDGGTLRIGPDNKLWVSVGDTGLGDVNGAPGTSTNPYSQDLGVPGGQDPSPRAERRAGRGQPVPEHPRRPREIYARGFRNPFRMGFDPQTGKLWVGDVGQNNFEELNILQSGANYAWPRCEGTEPPGCMQPGDVAPIYTYQIGDAGALGHRRRLRARRLRPVPGPVLLRRQRRQRHLPGDRERGARRRHLGPELRHQRRWAGGRRLRARPRPLLHGDQHRRGATGRDQISAPGRSNAAGRAAGTGVPALHRAELESRRAARQPVVHPTGAGVGDADDGHRRARDRQQPPLGAGRRSGSPARTRRTCRSR